MEQEETGVYTTKDDILRCVADPRWFHGSKVGPKQVQSGLEVVLGMCIIVWFFSRLCNNRKPHFSTYRGYYNTAADTTANCKDNLAANSAAK